MELDKTRNWPYYALGGSILFIIVLGGWWLYLVFKLAIKLKEMNSPILQGNLLMMVQWEGITFLSTTIFVGIAIIYIFYQDSKKSRATQSFYASLTHELKTPLASMRLQAQVLNDLVKKLEVKQEYKEKIDRYGIRLEEDSIRLENEIDRHLQLSRLGLNGEFNLSSLDPVGLIKKIFQSYPELDLNITQGDFSIIADQSAFEMMIKNLIENTLRHQGQTKNIEIKISEDSDKTIIHYNDFGKKFDGELKRLGNLYYKHNSPSGSGIGLYLIKRIMKKLQGKLEIINDSNLHFKLYFKRGNDE